MRTTLALLLVCLGVGGLILRSTRHSTDVPAEPRRSALVGEHNWAKHALDRTAEVKTAVAEHRKQSDDVR
jgi:hypothetical protein